VGINKKNPCSGFQMLFSDIFFGKEADKLSIPPKITKKLCTLCEKYFGRRTQKLHMFPDLAFFLSNNGNTHSNFTIQKHPILLSQFSNWKPQKAKVDRKQSLCICRYEVDWLGEYTVCCAVLYLPSL
jgi:hypothetical protein